MTLWGGVHSAYHLTKETLYAGGLTWHSLRVAEVRNTGAIQTHYTARTRYFPHPHYWFAQVIAQGDMTRCHRLWTRHPTRSTGDSDPLHSLRARHSPYTACAKVRATLPSPKQARYTTPTNEALSGPSLIYACYPGRFGPLHSPRTRHSLPPE